jgi:hypothetical protein
VIDDMSRRVCHQCGCLNTVIDPVVLEQGNQPATIRRTIAKIAPRITSVVIIILRTKQGRGPSKTLT